jgi:hypothetical protein
MGNIWVIQAIKRVGELAEDAGVSIHSILQNPIQDRLTDRMTADFVVTTEEAKVSQIQRSRLPRVWYQWRSDGTEVDPCEFLPACPEF